MYLSDIFTVPVSLAGLPALSLPGQLAKDGLPWGLQVIAPPWREDRMFGFASRLEAKLIEQGRNQA